jgi:hypothetical protein
VGEILVLQEQLLWMAPQEIPLEEIQAILTGEMILQGIQVKLVHSGSGKFVVEQDPGVAGCGALTRRLAV